MKFSEFITLYLADMEPRLKPSTIANKKNLIAHCSRLVARVFVQIVIFHRIVEYRGDLILQAFKISRRIRFALVIAVACKTFKARTISINKSYQRLGKEDVITTPKTPKSRRTITIPKILSECLQEYMSHVYELGENDRLFNCTKHYLTKEMVRVCKKSGRIRFALVIAVACKTVLPLAYIGRSDFVDRYFPEEWYQLGLDKVFLVRNRGHSRWKAETLAYYSRSELETAEPAELDFETRLKMRKEYLEAELKKKKD